MKKKLKINIDRNKVSSEEIVSKRNFERVLAQVKAFARPFYKSNLFVSIAAALAIAGIAVFTLFKMEADSKTMFHQNMLTTTSLPVQQYTIDPHKDTILVTEKGAKISIPAGAIVSSKNEPVALIIKEAYTIDDIVLSGLTTKSGTELLSSGGMIYLMPKDVANVRMQKPVRVSIPANEINTAMSLYKGETDAEGYIDWKEPQPVKNAGDPKISEGEALFKANCQSCHVIGKDSSVGPDLAHISRRREQDWLIWYTKTAGKVNTEPDMYREAPIDYVTIDVAVKMNDGGDTASGEVFHPSNNYASCLSEKYKNSDMAEFQALTDNQINAIYNYINTESDKYTLPYPDDQLYICMRKCEEYAQLMKTLTLRKHELQNTRSSKIADNGSFVKEVNALRTSLQSSATSSVSAAVIQQPSMVTRMNKQAEYYEIDINTFGWFNIDILMKKLPGMIESTLKVRVDESFKGTFSLYLMIPSLKMNAAGGPLKDQQNTYGFYEEDGSIPLPQNTAAYIYLVGEQNQQLLYASAVFQTTAQNDIQLKPETVSIEEFNTRIHALLNNKEITIEAQNSKNSAEIRRIDTDLKALDAELAEAEKLKPTECDCNCGLQLESDSVQ